MVLRKVLGFIHKAESIPTTIASVAIDTSVEVTKTVTSVPIKVIKVILRK